MKIITNIKSADKKGQKFCVSFENGSSLELNPEVIVKFKLTVGQFIDEQTLQQVNRESEFIKARNLVTRYLALRVKSAREIGYYLQNKGFSSATITAIIEHLKRKGEIDDYDYATRFVRQRKKLRPCGPLRLIKELAEKGIDNNIIEQVLIEQGVFSRDYQRALALKLAKKKCSGRKTFFPKHKQKLYNYLRQQGFESDIINQIINELVATCR